MKRATFDESVNLPPHGQAPEVKPAKGPKACAAHGCMFAGSMAESSHAQSWWCAYHYGCPAHDLPRVTSMLNEHAALRDVILEGRRVHSTMDIDPNTFPAIWQGMRDIVESNGYVVPPARGQETFPGWLQRVEALLGGYVVGVRKVGRRAA